MGRHFRRPQREPVRSIVTLLADDGLKPGDLVTVANAAGVTRTGTLAAHHSWKGDEAPVLASLILADGREAVFAMDARWRKAEEGAAPDLADFDEDPETVAAGGARSPSMAECRECPPGLEIAVASGALDLGGEDGGGCRGFLKFRSFAAQDRRRARERRKREMLEFAKPGENEMGTEHGEAQAPSCARKKHGEAQAPSCAEKKEGLVSLAQYGLARGGKELSMKNLVAWAVRRGLERPMPVAVGKMGNPANPPRTQWYRPADLDAFLDRVDAFRARNPRAMRQAGLSFWRRGKPAEAAEAPALPSPQAAVSPAIGREDFLAAWHRLGQALVTLLEGLR
jgi:hypothetical protein